VEVGGGLLEAGFFDGHQSEVALLSEHDGLLMISFVWAIAGRLRAFGALDHKRESRWPATNSR